MSYKTKTFHLSLLRELLTLLISKMYFYSQLVFTIFIQCVQLCVHASEPTIYIKYNVFKLKMHQKQDYVQYWQSFWTRSLRKP
jgi:pyoverdine/dityrosine biosynthesis protein Dit1